MGTNVFLLFVLLVAACASVEIKNAACSVALREHAECPIRLSIPPGRGFHRSLIVTAPCSPESWNVTFPAGAYLDIDEVARSGLPLSIFASRPVDVESFARFDAAGRAELIVAFKSSAAAVPPLRLPVHLRYHPPADSTSQGLTSVCCNDQLPEKQTQ